jgi:hypothetical protein
MSLYPTFSAGGTATCGASHPATLRDLVFATVCVLFPEHFKLFLTNENDVTFVKIDWTVSQDPVLLPEQSEIENTFVREAADGNEMGDVMGDVVGGVTFLGIHQSVGRSVGGSVSLSVVGSVRQSVGRSAIR